MIGATKPGASKVSVSVPVAIRVVMPAAWRAAAAWWRAMISSTVSARAPPRRRPSANRSLTPARTRNAETGPTSIRSATAPRMSDVTAAGAGHDGLEGDEIERLRVQE